VLEDDLLSDFRAALAEEANGLLTSTISRFRRE